MGTIDNLEGRLPKSHVSASGDSGEKNAISVFENSFVANYFLWTDGSWVEDNKDVCGDWYNENNQLRLVIRPGDHNGGPLPPLWRPPSTHAAAEPPRHFAVGVLRDCEKKNGAVNCGRCVSYTKARARLSRSRVQC